MPGAHGAVLDLAHHDVVALVARLRLGEAEAGHVRGAEGGSGDVDVLDRVGRHPGGVLDGDHALVGGLVGQRGAVDDVPDRVDAGGAGPHRAVDLDQAVLGQLYAGGLQAERADVRRAPGGDDQPIGLA